MCLDRKPSVVGDTSPLRLVVASVAIAALFLGCPEARDPDRIYGNGRIEADEVRVAARIAGRVREVAVDEGSEVKEGQPIAELSTPGPEAELDRAKAAVAAAKATLVQAETRLAVFEHHAEKARADFRRMRALRDSGAASEQKLDQAENALEEIEGERRVAVARVAQAEAALAEREASVRVVAVELDEGHVTSPIDGVVLMRLVEEGEVVQPGQPIVVVIDPQRLHLVVYLAESEIGKVRVGNPSRVEVDAFPERVFDGVVSRVAERAEFTPRDVHMPDERTRLVFAVEIRLENPERFLKPGMLADAWIRWRDGGGESA